MCRGARPASGPAQRLASRPPCCGTAATTPCTAAHRPCQRGWRATRCPPWCRTTCWTRRSRAWSCCWHRSACAWRAWARAVTEPCPGSSSRRWRVARSLRRSSGPASRAEATEPLGFRQPMRRACHRRAGVRGASHGPLAGSSGCPWSSAKTAAGAACSHHRRLSSGRSCWHGSRGLAASWCPGLAGAWGPCAGPRRRRLVCGPWQRASGRPRRTMGSRARGSRVSCAPSNSTSRCWTRGACHRPCCCAAMASGCQRSGTAGGRRETGSTSCP
mmetsp:Transcript_11778/g.32250  ORF Transcript_11778/g.32250 Transcript_11778/m.32250 type:complete len:273 (-) Transcript_11778:44-862(-)